MPRKSFSIDLLHALDPANSEFQRLASESGIMHHLRQVLDFSGKKVVNEVSELEALTASLPFFNALSLNDDSVGRKIASEIMTDTFPSLPTDSLIRAELFGDSTEDLKVLEREFFLVADEIFAVSDPVLAAFVENLVKWVSPSDLFEKAGSRFITSRILLYSLTRMKDIARETRLDLLNFGLPWYDITYPTSGRKELAVRFNQFVDVVSSLTFSNLRPIVGNFSNGDGVPKELYESFFSYPSNGAKFTKRFRRDLVPLFMESDDAMKILRQNSRLFDPEDFVGKFNTVYVSKLKEAATLKSFLADATMLESLQLYEAEVIPIFETLSRSFSPKESEWTDLAIANPFEGDFTYEPDWNNVFKKKTFEAEETASRLAEVVALQNPENLDELQEIFRDLLGENKVNLFVTNDIQKMATTVFEKNRPIVVMYFYKRRQQGTIFPVFTQSQFIEVYFSGSNHSFLSLIQFGVDGIFNETNNSVLRDRLKSLDPERGEVPIEKAWFTERMKFSASFRPTSDLIWSLWFVQSLLSGFTLEQVFPFFKLMNGSERTWYVKYVNSVFLNKISEKLK